METHAVVQLKAIANERVIRGYYKLRKAELIHALEATRLVEQKSNIFDEPIPNDPTPVLQPTPWRPSNITNLMINTRQTKVKLILSCMIEKADLKSGEVIAKEAAFHSKTEVNLESTDSNELFSKMEEIVLEYLTKFQRQGSN